MSKTYLKTSGSFVSVINGHIIKQVKSGDHIYDIQGVGVVMKFPTPTITLDGDILSTSVVEGVTKYKVYDNGEYIGYVDSNNIWHGLPLEETPANVSVSGTNLSFDGVVGAEKYEVFAEDTSIGEVDAVN